MSDDLTADAIQNRINEAGGEAARLHRDAINRLPRWHRWLLAKLEPPYPCVPARIPTGRVQLDRPLQIPPGVAIIGVRAP